MEKKTAIITGGSKGIGLAISKRFAKENYNIVIIYNSDDDSANSALNLIKNEYNADVLLIKGDISSEENVKTIVKTILDKYENINVLINNAAISHDKAFLDKTSEDFKEVLNTNLIGPFLMCKYLYNSLINTNKSSIINVSSTNGIDTFYPESADYDASKAGLISLTKNLSKVFSPCVRVNAVAPGWVNTSVTDNLYVDFRKEEENKILLGRFAEPEEIANVVYFLSSSDASYINGEVIVVDGGKNGY